MGKLSLLAFLVSTFAMAAEPVLVKEVTQRGNLMPSPGTPRPLYTTLEVEVQSTGCTKAQDFAVKVTQGPKSQNLEIIRETPDDCEAVPHRTTVALETKDLSLGSRQPIIIQNPIFAEEHVVY